MHVVPLIIVYGVEAVLSVEIECPAARLVTTTQLDPFATTISAPLPTPSTLILCNTCKVQANLFLLKFISSFFNM